MARSADVQYIRFAVDGNAARKAESQPAPYQQAKLPKVFRSRCKRIYVDPVAIFGILVAACMLVMMLVGVARLSAQRKELEKMESYVQLLQEENSSLEKTYHESYNAEEVERTALALGMRPKTEASSVSLQIDLPTEQEHISVWHKMGTFLTNLFA